MDLGGIVVVVFAVDMSSQIQLGQFHPGYSVYVAGAFNGWPNPGTGLGLVLTNYPEGQIEELEADINPEDPSAGKRKIPFGRELWIEQDDFMENPPRKFFRLSPGREVRLKYAFYVTCTDVVKDPKTGEPTGMLIDSAQGRVSARVPRGDKDEAEQALLGAILVNNEAFYRVSDFLEPKHFFEPIHQAARLAIPQQRRTDGCHHQPAYQKGK